MDARNRKLAEWLPRIRCGQVQLPRFQRFEAWGYAQVASLLESVINDLPVGAVTVLDVGDKSDFKHREIAGAPAASERLTELLLDGQQRLTALWRSLTGNYDDRSYFLRLDDDAKTEYGGYAITSLKRTTRDGVKYPLWADDPQELFARGHIPVTLLLPETLSNQGGLSLKEWIERATDGDATAGMTLLDTLSTLRARVTSYNLPCISLPIGTSKSVVLEVFTKINTGSTPLTAFDIITADIEDEVGDSLHDLLNTLTGSVTGITRYGDVQDIVLRTAALMQDRSPDRPNILHLDWRRMVDDWPAMVEGARLAVEFLEQERMFDSTRLPIVTAVPALIALWASTKGLKPDEVGAARTNLRRYFWRAMFTERYESSAHTHVIRDVRELSEVIAGKRPVDGVEIFNLPLPGDQDVLGAGWPKKRDRLARGILAISIYGGAIDLADGSVANAATLPRREYHHVFPEGYLKKIGAKMPSALALNCALITWKTNRTISDKEPLQYMKDRAEASSLGDEEILYRLKSHAIPAEPLSANDYEQFLVQRAEIVEAAIADLCAGKPWSP